jgi:anti-sigma B factor antagonist
MSSKGDPGESVSVRAPRIDNGAARGERRGQPAGQETSGGSMPNPFVVTRSTAGEGDKLVVLSLDGFLDAYTAPGFEAAIQSEMEAGRVQLVVDCQKLSYISSAGLGVFMGFIEEIREKGGDIKISGLNPKVRQVFELLGFPALYDIAENLPEAVAQFTHTPQKEV